MITKQDTVIAQVNTLGGDQPKHLTFTDRHVRPNGYVEILWVGAKSDGEDL